MVTFPLAVGDLYYDTYVVRIWGTVWEWQRKGVWGLKLQEVLEVNQLNCLHCHPRVQAQEEEEGGGWFPVGVGVAARGQPGRPQVRPRKGPLVCD